MHPDWESEVEPEEREQKAANADRDALRRAQMIARALERKAYWQKELAAERFEEFRPEMRRRIQVEQTLIDGLEAGELPTFVLMRTYQQDAVHMPDRPKTAREDEREDLETRIGKAVQRKRDLEERLRLTPEKQPGVRGELIRKIGNEQDYIVDLKNKLRMHQV